MFGAPCAQSVLGDWNKRDSETSSEDCLFLNVITPQWPSKSRLPVMVWIHGGANAGGTASSDLYKDGTLVQHGVLLVTLNYRLSIFGFLSHPDLTKESPHHASGNYALMDQIAALRWVHDNIAQFGGDPNNVTLFGQSAGAQDTSLLMTSPLAKGLFQRAIAQSGSGINPPATSLADSERGGEKIASQLKPPAGTSAIKYMRALSTQDLLGSMANQDPAQPPLIGPNVDGWVITVSPDKVFYTKRELAIPLMVGTTAREFAFPNPTDQVRKFIQSVTGNLSDRALRVYGLADNRPGLSDPLYGSAGDQWFSDLLFRCPVSIQAEWHSTLNGSTYQYELVHTIPGHENEGAAHSSDLPYVFGFYPKAGNISGKFDEVDFKLADLIETYWANFARTGNPNSNGLPNWPESGEGKNFIRFKQGGSVEVISGGLRTAQCDVLREVLKQRVAIPETR
jgi:para-nitrobenzyl esterase